ncbi:MAG: nicotinate-nucleotide adenylyltransferase [Firmicutes bacterium]|nr:nicotinate-nucleotide adenylyltransferase [Bacillota bacterium]
MGKKIGIMGGTFNPIHNGHLMLAEAARETFELDQVLFIPSGISYMKNVADILDGRHRAEMIALAIKENPYFALSMIEIDREGPTYTFETLQELKKDYPKDQFYFIMGADSLLTLETWKKPEFIMQNCTLVVAVRGTGTEEKIEKLAANLIYEYQADIKILPARFIDISSSEIRTRIKEKQSIRYMLPESVLSYIEENKLYSIMS